MYEIMKDALHQALKRMGPNAPVKFSNDMEEGMVTFSQRYHQCQIQEQFQRNLIKLEKYHELN